MWLDFILITVKSLEKANPQQKPKTKMEINFLMNHLIFNAGKNEYS